MKIILLSSLLSLASGLSCPDGQVGEPPDACRECDQHTDCYGRGTPIAIKNNTCICHCSNKWKGQNCGQCDDKYDQSTCSSCNTGRVAPPDCVVCNVLNFCDKGGSEAKVVNSEGQETCKCMCRNNWAGEKCNICPNEFSEGSDCSQCNPGWKPASDGGCKKCTRSNDCSGRGDPSEHDPGCVCECDAGYKPPDCLERIDETFSEVASFRKQLPFADPIVAFAAIQQSGIAVRKTGLTIVDLNSKTTTDQVVRGTFTFPSDWSVDETASIPLIEVRRNLDGMDLVAIMFPSKGVLFIDFTILSNITLLATAPVSGITSFVWRSSSSELTAGDTFIDFTWAEPPDKGGIATKRVSLGTTRTYPITNRISTSGSHAVVRSDDDVVKGRDLYIINDNNDLLILESDLSFGIRVIGKTPDALPMHQPRLQFIFYEETTSKQVWLFALTPATILGYQLFESGWQLVATLESGRSGNQSFMTIADVQFRGNIMKKDSLSTSLFITDPEFGISKLKIRTLRRDDFPDEIFSCSDTNSRPGILVYTTDLRLIATCLKSNDTAQMLTVVSENQAVTVQTFQPDSGDAGVIASNKESIRLPIVVSCLVCLLLTAIACILKLRSDISKPLPFRGSLLNSDQLVEVSPANPIGREIPWGEFSNLLLVGEGNSGCVFKALYAVTGETVALKESKKKLDEHFTNEINILCSLVQKDILMLYGWARNEGSLYMITEFCSRGCLDKFVNTNTMGREAIALSMGSIASALGYIHGRKLAHCDVAARNILVNESFSFKLADMGLMTEQDTCITKPIAVAWSPPESLSSVRIATQYHDVWSFGCLLYEVLTGRYPFSHIPRQPSGSKHKRLSLIRLAIVKGDLPQKPESCSAVTEAIWEQVILKCWNRDPKRRLTTEQIISNLKTIRDEFSIDSLPLINAVSATPSSSEVGVYSSGNHYTTGQDCTGDDLVYSLYTDLDLHVSPDPQHIHHQYDYGLPDDSEQLPETRKSAFMDETEAEYLYTRMQSDTIRGAENIDQSVGCATETVHYLYTRMASDSDSAQSPAQNKVTSPASNPPTGFKSVVPLFSLSGAASSQRSGHITSVEDPEYDYEVCDDDDDDDGEDSIKVIT
eukprot:TRINITY_DN18505_c0_g1_i1.p1 TRINITY_DN18505_c0_g1~~TRINITY_DN18505_c0_g1_i1.p1  ORF type:complete len:1111 (+),score=180.84 TRINITY_DN18505_c0_g1_i1:78-3410(+)